MLHPRSVPASGVANTQARSPLLAPGDRAPDFMLPDQNKKVDALYDLVKGGPVVLHFYPNNDKAAYTSERDQLIAGLDQLDAVGAHFFAINTDRLETNIDLAEKAKWPFSLLTDPLGRIHRLLGVPVLDRKKSGVSPTRSIVTYLLDSNLRVLKTIQGRRGVSHAEQVLDFLAEQGPVPEPRQITMAAPVLLIPRVLDRDFCQNLIELWEVGGNQESGIISGNDRGTEVREIRHSTKRRRDHSVKDPTLFRELNEIVHRRIAPEVKRVFNTIISGVEDFKVARYDAEEGGYFRPHRDNSYVTRAQRRFAVTLNLNTGYEGGHLRFAEYGPHVYRPDAGDAVVFSCALLHEALDVTKGQRYVLLFFLLDHASRKWRQENASWFEQNANALEDGLRAVRKHGRS